MSNSKILLDLQVLNIIYPSHQRSITKPKKPQPKIYRTFLTQLYLQKNLQCSPFIQLTTLITNPCQPQSLLSKW